MPYNPFDMTFDDLPDVIPIFPLGGALLLPRGELPLNIFEPRYVAMVQDVMTGNRLIGMIQPHYKIGCVGRIVKFEETIDGRYLISLRGQCRFHMVDEAPPSLSGYRRAHVSWKGFDQDMERRHHLDWDKNSLKLLLQDYFSLQGLAVDWDLMDGVGDESLLTTLAMVCPLPSAEKQALLEAECVQTRARLLMQLLDMAVRAKMTPPSTQ